MPHGFSVDMHSDDEACDEAIKQLERMVNLGKQAQVALDAIRSHGFYEGEAPVAGPASRQWYNGSRVALGHTVWFAMFQKRQPFSRADLPPLGNLQLVFKEAKHTKYSGHPCIQIPLYCKGQVARQVDAEGTLKFFEVEQCLGTIRVNKHHLSFIENSSSKTVYVFPNLAKAPPEKALESATVFAERLARLMVDLSDASSAAGEFVQMTARTLDLQKHAPAWFIADGVVQRMYDEIHRYASVLKVMEA